MANPEHLAILKQGVKVWNQWRNENSEIEPDLSQCCLQNLDLRKVLYLAKRVLNALEKGGAAWLQAKLINPSASFLVATLEDWRKNK